MKKQEIKEKIEDLLVNVEFEASDRINLVDEKAIYGDTYKIKDVIREMGGKWEPRNKRWKLRSKTKAELIVEVATQKIYLIEEEQYQKKVAEEAAKREANIMEIVEEYSMTDEQHSAFRDLIAERENNRRFMRFTFREMTKSFLDKIVDQRDPKAVYKEEQEKIAREQEEAKRKQELEDAQRILEESRKRQEEKRLLKEAENLKKASYFEDLTGEDVDDLLKNINKALKLVSLAKIKGFMYASDKQTFRSIQSDVGRVIDVLKDKKYSNSALLEFYDHNDNRIDRIDADYLSLSQIVNLKPIN
ncbi:hypothetical protein [Vibrio sp. HN007]|uniref:hypothetical protein n=1 Tax=Vibrio iocasae TaxID=3098914 RepID=UPI0035D5232D